ncbi:MAG TPA: hypothetical protein VHC49_01380 [Mycobacteriales bacterium]|nr:hypothetical protein [Mycobacteriales bacterium]
MEVVLLVVGDQDTASLRAVAGRVRTVAVADRPERADLDAALDSVVGSRLGVVASDAGLGAVVRRLLHRSELAATPIAILGSPGVRERYGLSGDPVRELLSGSAAPAGLVRDDHSGVTLNQAQLQGISGPFGIRAYVEEHELVNRYARSLTVRPGAGELVAAVELPGLRRGRSRGGRAVTVSCEEARSVIDGVEQPRPRTRCTWWYEPDAWSIYR